MNTISLRKSKSKAEVAEAFGKSRFYNLYKIFMRNSAFLDELEANVSNNFMQYSERYRQTLYPLEIALIHKYYKVFRSALNSSKTR